MCNVTDCKSDDACSVEVQNVRTTLNFSLCSRHLQQYIMLAMAQLSLPEIVQIVNHLSISPKIVITVERVA